MATEDVDSPVQIVVTGGGETQASSLALILHSEEPPRVARPSLRHDLVMVLVDVAPGVDVDKFQMTLTEPAARKLAADIRAVLGE
jgi:hypothetical protein